MGVLTGDQDFYVSPANIDYEYIHDRLRCAKYCVNAPLLESTVSFIGTIRHAEKALLRGRGLNLTWCGKSRAPACDFQAVLNTLDFMQSHMLREVLWEKQVQGPAQRHAQLFLEARQFHEVNGSPQPPCQNAREVKAEDVGHASAASDDRELTESCKRKWPLRFPANCGDDVFRAVPALT
jgi:hypothetical protein